MLAVCLAGVVLALLTTYLVLYFQRKRSGNRISGESDASRLEGDNDAGGLDAMEALADGGGGLSLLTPSRLADPWFAALPPAAQQPVRKVAVCIGINYSQGPSSMRLTGCCNDAALMCQMLEKQFGFDAHHIFVLADPAPGPETTHFREIGGEPCQRYHKPTRAHIEKSVRQLVQLCNQYSGPTEVVFTYAGHGHYVADTNQDEKDGRDETLVPCDLGSGPITDDWLRQQLTQLPARCRWFMIFDCCHSGTIGDQEYVYTGEDFRFQHHPSTSHKFGRMAAEVVTWTGCADTGTSAEAWAHQRVHGLLTFTLHREVTQRPDVTVSDLLRKLTRQLSSSQIPHVSSSRLLNHDTRVFPAVWSTVA